ncbi:MAG: hypothetical protein AAF236_10625 [Verrucomicrobiota bacterium]
MPSPSVDGESAESENENQSDDQEFALMPRSSTALSRSELITEVTDYRTIPRLEDPANPAGPLRQSVIRDVEGSIDSREAPERRKLVVAFNTREFRPIASTGGDNARVENDSPTSNRTFSSQEMKPSPGPSIEPKLQATESSSPPPSISYRPIPTNSPRVPTHASVADPDSTPRDSHEQSTPTTRPRSDIPGLSATRPISAAVDEPASTLPFGVPSPETGPVNYQHARPVESATRPLASTARASTGSEAIGSGSMSLPPPATRPLSQSRASGDNPVPPPVADRPQTAPRPIASQTLPQIAASSTASQTRSSPALLPTALPSSPQISAGSGPVEREPISDRPVPRYREANVIPWVVQLGQTAETLGQSIGQPASLILDMNQSSELRSGDTIVLPVDQILRWRY